MILKQKQKLTQQLQDLEEPDAIKKIEDLEAEKITLKKLKM